MTAAVVRLALILRFLLGAPVSLLLLQDDRVEVAPLLHQLPRGRVAHLVGLTRQGAAQPVRTQDNCRQICTGKKKNTLVGQLLQFDPRSTLISVRDPPCTLETECRKSLSRLLLRRQGYLVLG